MADILELDGVSAGYGEALVLSDITLRMADGTALALLGRNGAGKTTLVNTIVGLTRRRGGTIALAGRDITTWAPERRAMAGIGWVPQERNIFRSLSVEENITAVLREGPWTLARIYALFPRLEERRHNRGGQLSGGEQQMLAVGRALALNPRLLLLDEPLEGLAPIIVENLLDALRSVLAEGMAAILVEQSPAKILPLTDQAIILERGRVAYIGSSRELAADQTTLGALLGVAASGT